MKSRYGKILVLSIFGCSAVSAVYGKDKGEETFKIKKNPRLNIETIESNYKIYGHSKDEISVKYKKIDFTEKECELKITQNGSQVNIEVESKESGSIDCEIDFDIQVPQKTNLKISNASGDFRLYDLQGEVNGKLANGDVKVKGDMQDVYFKIGRGDVKLNGDYKKLKFEIGTGEVKLDGSVAEAKFAMGAGDVEINFDKALEGIDIVINSGVGDVDIVFEKKISKGDLVVKAGVGDTKIRIPKGMKIDTDHSSGIGSFKNYVGDSRKSEFDVTVKAGAGSLVIDNL